MIKNLNKKAVIAAAAVMASAGLLLTGCSPASVSGASSITSSPALAELTTVLDNSIHKASESGFTEDVTISGNTFKLLYNPKGNGGAGQTGMQQVSSETTDEEGVVTKLAKPETTYTPDTGFANFDALMIKQVVLGGDMFIQSGGTVAKNGDGTFLVKSDMSPEIIVTVKDGLVVGIKQNYGTDASGKDQVMKSKITYSVSKEDQKLLDDATANADKVSSESVQTPSGPSTNSE